MAWIFLGGINLLIFSSETRMFEYDGFYTFPIGLSFIFFIFDLALFTFWRRLDVLLHKSQEYLLIHGENECKDNLCIAEGREVAF